MEHLAQPSFNKNISLYFTPTLPPLYKSFLAPVPALGIPLAHIGLYWKLEIFQECNKISLVSKLYIIVPSAHIDLLMSAVFC